MKAIEYGTIFRDREEASRVPSERAVAETERDPIADWHAGFRLRARGEEEPNEGEQE